MRDITVSVLIVEDDEVVRTSLADVIAFWGYRTRSVADGFAALIEIRQEVPDILLSDLNMPAMSGFELLSIIRRRFPAIYVIAMSGMFTESKDPPGVTADAFYRKGGGVDDLVRILETRPLPKRGHPEIPETIWIHRNGHDSVGRDFVTIACPECFRTFRQAINGTAGQILDTSCVFCHEWILYGIFDPQSREFPQRRQPVHSLSSGTSVARRSELNTASKKEVLNAQAR